MSAYVIDTASLKSNIEICRRTVGNVKLYAVVKGDGYGLGLLPYSRILRAKGLTELAVTEPEDAKALRTDGFAGEILMLRSTSDPEEIKQLLEADAVFTIGSTVAFSELNLAASKLEKTVQAHVYMDVGMGREGFDNRDREGLRAVCQAQGCVKIAGAYTHFPSAEDPEDTKRRFAVFMQLIEFLHGIGWTGTVHCANSCTALYYPEMRLDAVRIGSGFLGRVPILKKLGLRQIGYIETEISAVKRLEPGDTVGYGCAFKARRKTEIGVLNIGYYHGFGTERVVNMSSPKDYVRAMLEPAKELLRGKKKDGVRQWEHRLRGRLRGNAEYISGHHRLRLQGA
jgi:alanine racemase